MHGGCVVVVVVVDVYLVSTEQLKPLVIATFNIKYFISFLKIFFTVNFGKPLLSRDIKLEINDLQGRIKI